MSKKVYRQLPDSTEDVRPRKYKQLPDKTLIASALRRAFTRTKTYREFMASQPVQYRGKRRFHPCAHCQTWLTKSKLDLDHIEPVVAPDNLDAGWDEYITRCFAVKPEGLQLLCKSCHKVKSAPEIKARAAARRAKKAG